MFGRSAALLVRELTTDDHHLRRFNYDLFDKVISEIQEHFQQVTTIMEKMQGENEDGQISSADENYNGALIHHQSILRNKRCLLAYMYHRANRLQRLRWQLGAVLPEDVKELLHPSEKEFVKSYSEALSSYMTKLDIDLAVDITPPKDPYIQVRVLNNIGEVLLGDQSTSLVRNSIHFVKRSEAETLISQGLLEEFTG
ncbi:uncharacterized protein [Physcomitrium patens]|uniref:GINS subunit domain-containing protein n=2 Tax=Physcomitrium patens TaxID=3218 RepID=A0A2K1IVK3_PHYPA|nr:probable DNA replication complex GINS protein PSF1 isoform X1 [Physcomitrium patens]XP_024358165.1 probable DNA replication complex GINS protein PSF1 isoform X1 [Physcomitrium patens]PNR33290.1 hypothetical protein PHYPA_025233 [Physcomitrium patens]PNR33304.1 hypothetical protein PHYPA_025247 [Physcomitrium patens]|eukprot:XP_024357662.1 probable DNA replication complex GINS protein PSF1 isoform X1 [Physcomitrella patens]